MVVEVPRVREPIEDAEVVDFVDEPPLPDEPDTEVIDLVPAPTPAPAVRARRITDAYAPSAPVLPRPTIAVG